MPPAEDIPFTLLGPKAEVPPGFWSSYWGVAVLGVAAGRDHVGIVETEHRCHRALPDRHGLLDTIGRLERSGVGGFVQLFVDNDPGDPERYLVFVEQAGLGLPDESYYRDEAHADTRTAYRGHIERMLALAGLDAELFYIPTHAHLAADMQPRHDGIADAVKRLGLA